ncbi:MAG: RidA family protein [Lysobacterales bacterium]|jgi:enamine deaminase RidA (YjgF/YER057c/UK114 family)
MQRQTVNSGSPFEETFAFSRACRIGNIIAVAGTAPLGDDGKTVCRGDAYGQARRCFEISLRAIEALGGDIGGVIRTRMMLCNADDWPEVARAHGDVFAGIDPAATCIVVKGLLDPEWLVETEVDCLLT